jgi:flavin-dependent dehydrogenase
MDLYLFKGGYGGLSLVEGDAATLCLVVRRSALRKTGDWPKLLASIQQQTPHLAQRLQGALPLWDRPLAVSAIPYGYLAGGPNLPNLWRLGDQAACIPSFTGDGMSIALHSASLAAAMHLAGKSSNEYHQALKSHLHRGMLLATTLSRFMVTSFGRTFAPTALSIYPGAMQTIASLTRIPDKALIDPL